MLCLSSMSISLQTVVEFQIRINRFCTKITIQYVLLTSLKPRNLSRLALLLSSFRIDLVDFELDGGSAIDKPCDRDSVTVRTPSFAPCSQICSWGDGHWWTQPWNWASMWGKLWAASVLACAGSQVIFSILMTANKIPKGGLKSLQIL